MRKSLALAAAAVLVLATQASAHKLVRAGVDRETARDAFIVSPAIDWNRLSGKEGRYQEIWSLDGDQLNKVTFFGGVPVGQPLFRELDRRNRPLPKVSENMLITDIPALLENSYRAEGRARQMSIDSQRPAQLDGRSGISFTYTYVFSDDAVERRGEALGAFIDGKLFLVTYEAPKLYFFDKSAADFRQLLSTLRLKA